jgi:hypothetical protein
VPDAAEEPTATCWTGAQVFCDDDECHGRVDYVEDVDHDDGSCEVFKCRACGKRVHVELPD